VAQELSRVPAANGKETSHGDGSLPLRQIRLEGLGALIHTLHSRVTSGGDDYNEVPAGRACTLCG